MVGERLDPDVRIELRRRLPHGQAHAGRRRASNACEPTSRQGPGDQRRRLYLRRRQPGRPAVPRMEAERSVLQSEPADGPLQVQPCLPVQRDDDEARAVRLDAEIGEGP